MVQTSERAGEELTIERLWVDAGFHPTEAQSKAINHVAGPLYLPAGPGSGKTRVLLWRTVNLIVFHEVSPDSIFLSTFTDKAATQLKEGLSSLLANASSWTGRPYDTGRMYVGTVHSLCERLLRDRRLQPPGKRARPPVLVDELEQYLFVARRRTWTKLCEAAGLPVADAAERLTTYFGGRPSKSKHEAVSRCIDLFNRLSEECVDHVSAGVKTNDEMLRACLRMYGEYLALLRTAEKVPYTDFALLQQEALALLEKSSDAAQRFAHVIVDEYQDTNSIQERLFFELGKSSLNLCVVGDDDQALYRFRGATVENFVQFPIRCERALGKAPVSIPLVRNYRSRAEIVDASALWLRQTDWSRDGVNSSYRVADKQIQAERQPDGPAVIRVEPSKPDAVCAEAARLVRALIDNGRVRDPNEIAFLYPSLHSPHVVKMIAALELVGLRAYAPRANTFLATEEASQMLGLFAQILGIPQTSFTAYGDWRDFLDWLRGAHAVGGMIAAQDADLARFIAQKKGELEAARNDYAKLVETCVDRNWDIRAPFDSTGMSRVLSEVRGISESTRRNLTSKRLYGSIRLREAARRPHALAYVVQRATAIDWSVLDLFYRLSAFEPFPSMFAAAERSTDPDEGPISNLGLLTQYLSTFMDRRAPIISGELLQNDLFQKLFFYGYLYALFKRGESEFEDTEDPFPKGRIPFLTIHQSKGLEFPVVVLGNLRKDDKGAPAIERIVRPLLAATADAEPLNRLGKFDIARMYYVAITRAEECLILMPYSGAGQRTNSEFAPLLQSAKSSTECDPVCIPIAKSKAPAAPSAYSYTGDFLAYRRCPRQYAVFRKFGFVPSRSQTMLFGTLVHRTLEDLHDHLLRERNRA